VRICAIVSQYFSPYISKKTRMNEAIDEVTHEVTHEVAHEVTHEEMLDHARYYAEMLMAPEATYTSILPHLPEINIVIGRLGQKKVRIRQLTAFDLRMRLRNLEKNPLGKSEPSSESEPPSKSEPPSESDTLLKRFINQLLGHKP
jgi:hypothetical protein